MEEEDDAISNSRSQSPSPSPSQSQYDSQSSPPPHSAHPVTVAAAAASPLSAPSLSLNGSRITELVTVAAPPQHHGSPVALPIQQPRASYGGGGGGGGGREDCWSEGATSTLIDAWGERYVELGRGSLKQKQWQEVADAVAVAVASRDGYTKNPKTDVQCKNRIDTLKKKYKNEKAKIAAGGGGPATSSWPFFHRLDILLGHNTQKTAPNPARQPLTAPSRKNPEGVPIRQSARFPQRQRTNRPAFKKMKPSSPRSASSKSGDSSADSSDGLPPATLANSKKRQPEPADEEGRIAGLRELTQAILRFGEVYDRVESSKLQQAMEMEKQRMSFSRELEVQRMEFLMKTQMELSKLKIQHRESKMRRRTDEGSKNDGGNSTSHRHHRNNAADNNGSDSNNSDHNG